MRVVHQRGGLRGLRRLRREVELPVSVQPVETEFGRKTQIHQSSCNKDYSCLRRRLPVVPHRDSARRAAEEGAQASSRSTARCPSPSLQACRATRNVFMMGIGGTGVVTVNQILGTAAAARRQARARARPDRAQPEGRPGRLAPEDLRASRDEVSNKVAAGDADCYLGFDILVATSPAEPRPRAPGHARSRWSRRARCRPARWSATTDVHFPDAERRCSTSHQPRARARTRTSTSTRSGWPRRSSTTTWPRT